MRREWTPSQEVFREGMLESLRSLPVIVGHTAWITPANYSKHAVGVVDAGTTKRRGGFLDGVVTVQDQDALRRIDSSELGDLSLGYAIKWTAVSGIVPEGEPDAGKRYDGIKSNIVPNHLALLRPGHARAEVGFRFDGRDEPVFTSEPYAPPAPPVLPERKPMPLIVRLDSKEYDLSTPEGVAAHGAAVDKIRQDARDADTRAAKAEGIADGYKTTIATLETQVKDTTRLDSLVATRVALESSARTVLGDKYDCRGKKNREIQIDVIRHDAKDFTGLGQDGKSATGDAKPDAYVEARFDSVIEHAIPAGSIHDLRHVINPTRPVERRQDSRGEDEPRVSASERARIANDEYSRNAWQR